MRTILAFCLFTAPFWTCLQAQQNNPQFQQYIDQYKDIAVQQMRKHHIPASIILAQAILESGAGNSPLAQKSNNHFGIKRGSDWQGPVTTHFDDGRTEYFRVYDNVNDSYEDHSRFLKRERYQRLYRLSILDYKGWARGLKACGYATSPTYADRLIDLIERYHLDQLDEDPNAPFRMPELPPLQPVKLNYRSLHTNNDTPCIHAQQGDTWQEVSQKMHLSIKKLLQFNEATLETPIRQGDYIYLAKKPAKAAKEWKGKWHTVRPEDSMHSIAQRYGMRMKTLYKLNLKSDDFSPSTGDLIKIR